MPTIHVLDSETIDKIAAGEVVERPASVIKELVENAIDAGATAITVEIKDGGIEYIRVTDNGCGIEKSELPKAILRHATSKITNAMDLKTIHSLGFRGEALSSIGAVSRMEIITKTKDSLVGVRLLFQGGVCGEMEEIGAPEGTTFLVRNLFYNTPVRRKFLKQPATEAGYIAEILEHLALSNPHISFQFKAANQLKFHTPGNGDLKEVIYRIYGKEAAREVVPIKHESNGISITGYLGKPVLVRSNRNYETYFINGRYVKSNMMANAIEEGYKEYLMQHKFPFCVLHIELDPELVDVNVHPTKMEVRFSNGFHIQSVITSAIYEALHPVEFIPAIDPEQLAAKNVQPALVPKEPVPAVKAEEASAPKEPVPAAKVKEAPPEPFERNRREQFAKVQEESGYGASSCAVQQMELFEEKILQKKNLSQLHIYGQVFDTYWIVGFESSLLLIDQHAAHEKVKYERLMKHFRSKDMITQELAAPIVVTLKGRERALFEEFKESFTRLGFEIESFGGEELLLRGVPLDLYGSNGKDLFLSIIDELEHKENYKSITVIEEKLASMACKAAVKGNTSFSAMEAKALLEELMTLENPYHCPHGRPTIVRITKNDMDKMFKRIL